jgi:hypothetical protein
MRDYAAVESVYVPSYFLDSSAQSVYVFVCMILVVHSNEDVRNLPLLLLLVSASLFHLSVFSLIAATKNNAQHSEIQRSAAAAAFGIRLFVRPTAAAFFVDDADDKICCL